MIEVSEVTVLDYTPTEEARAGINKCQRCGWAPEEYRPSSLKNNLWSAPCVLDRSQVDGLTASGLVWQILCGAANPDVQWADGSTGIDGRGCLKAMPEVRLPESLWVRGDDE